MTSDYAPSGELLESRRLSDDLKKVTTLVWPWVLFTLHEKSRVIYGDSEILEDSKMTIPASERFKVWLHQAV